MTRNHLHVRDHGGEGPALLLLHGAGRSHADWDSVAPHLLPHHRVLAVDLPGHGLSDPPASGGWSFEGTAEALEDLLAAHDALPVGHSLGGMLAAHLAATRPGIRAAVNLDGFWWGASGDAEARARISAVVRAGAGAVNPAHLDQQVAHAAGLGIDPEVAERSARAAARELPGGGWQTLPLRDTALAMFDALDALDLFALFRRAACPLLLVRAERKDPAAPPGMEWFDDFLAGYRVELTRALAGLTADRPDTVTVRGIDATHAMTLEEPKAVASLITEFTSRV